VWDLLTGEQYILGACGFLFAKSVCNATFKNEAASLRMDEERILHPKFYAWNICGAFFSRELY